LNARARAPLLAALFLALPFAAPAHERDGGQADDRLVDKYTRFAGSERNAESLVHGLRNDSQVKLYSHRSSTSFTPPTDKMGYGNVDISLSLAKATLADHGIHRPTPEQIKAALNGGTITTKSGERVALEGILKQRASGMGWGQVAQANGFKLGEVMRHKHHRHDGKHHDGKNDHKHAGGKHHHKHSDWKHHHKHADREHDHRDRHHADWKHDRHHADWKHDRGDFHRVRFDRPDHPHKFDRPERPERPERHHRR
jgi:hypothetical protein